MSHARTSLPTRAEASAASGPSGGAAANSLITVNVPVRFENEDASPGLKRGGVLNVVRHSVEVLADRIADRLLSDFPKLERVRVRVHKPFAPLPGIFRDVCAELEKAQGEQPRGERAK